MVHVSNTAQNQRLGCGSYRNKKKAISLVLIPEVWKDDGKVDENFFLILVLYRENTALSILENTRSTCFTPPLALGFIFS